MADPFGLGEIYDDMKYLGRRVVHSVGPDSNTPYQEPPTPPPPKPPAGKPPGYAKGMSKVGQTRMGMPKRK